jgi:hypothetical protein
MGRQIWGVTAERAFDDRTAPVRSASAAPWAAANAALGSVSVLRST